MGCRVHRDLAGFGEDLAGHRIDHRDPLHLVSPQLDADHRFLVGGVDLDGVAPDPEPASGQVAGGPLVLDVHQPADGPLLVQPDPLVDAQDPPRVLLG